MRHAVRPLRGGLVATARQQWGSQERRMSGIGDKHRWVALWGNGDYGRLGQASGESFWEPTVCKSMQHLQPIALACGGAHTLVLTEEGRVYASGLNDWGQLGLPLSTGHSMEFLEVEGLPDEAKFTHIAAGDFHSAAISEDGRVYMWGRNTQGQLGLGKRGKGKVCAAQWVESLKDFRIQALALGAEHSLALSEEGEVLSWGTSLNGRLGHGEGHRSSSMFSIFRKSSEYTPRLVKGFRDVKVSKVAAGLTHSACLDEQGSLFTFGKGRECQLGLGGDRDISEPKRVPVIPPVEEIACGGYHTGAISRNGQLYMWGSNEYGCLGFGYKHQNATSLPMLVEGALESLRVTQVQCGWKHTMALTVDGDVFAWGWGGSQGTHGVDGLSSGGQLGLGNENDFLEPTQVKSKKMKAIQISCGFNHSGAILEEQ